VQGMSNLDQSTGCPAGYSCGIGTDRSTMLNHQCPAGYFCGADTKPSEQYDKMCPAGFYCLHGTQEALALRNKCNSGYFCPKGTSSVEEVETRCPRLTTSSNGASRLVQCDINEVDLCDKRIRSPRNPFEDASYYSFHQYEPLDKVATSLTVLNSLDLRAPTGEIMVAAKVIPINEISSDPFWKNDTIEVFRTCPEYSDAAGYEEGDLQPGIVVMGRNFRKSPLLQCRFTPCLGDAEMGADAADVFGLVRRCRDSSNGEYFRDYGDGSYADSAVGIVSRAEYISPTRVRCKHPGYRFFSKDAVIAEGRNTSACYNVDGRVGFISSCGTLAGPCPDVPLVGYQLIYDLVVPCNAQEIAAGTCAKMPDPSQNTKFNPCITGEVKVDVTNDGRHWSGEGLTVNHSSVIEMPSTFADYNVAPSWAVFTYVMAEPFVEHERKYPMTRQSCNRSKYSEEGPRDRERGWYALRSMEIAQVSLDLKHLPRDFKYPDHWKIAIYVTPSRCLDERCNSNRVRIAAHDLTPCRQPVDLTPWFLDPSVPKQQVLNFTVFALEDVLMKVEIHLLHGLYAPLVPFLMNSTTIQIKSPERANVTKGTMYRGGDNEDFELVVGRDLPTGNRDRTSAATWHWRKLSPYISYEEAIVQDQYFFGIRYDREYADDISPPYNMPPLYSDYAKGRVLLSFNTTKDSVQTPTVRDNADFRNDDGSKNPYTSGALRNGWWDQVDPSYLKTKELIDTYFETFHGYELEPKFELIEKGPLSRVRNNQTILADDISPSSTSSFERVLLPYMPFFSNCREFDSYIPFHHLVEDSACELPDFDEDFANFVGEEEGTFRETWPIRTLFPPYPHPDDIYSVGPWQIYEQPIADWCERSIMCDYEEDLKQQDIAPRWMEASTGDALFYFLRMPLRYQDYVGRKFVELNPMTKRSSVSRTHPMDIGGGRVVQNLEDKFGDDYFIPLSVNRDAAADSDDIECATTATGCFPHAMDLYVYYYQMSPNVKRLVKAEIEYDDFDLDVSRFEYSVDLHYSAMSWEDLLIAFAFDPEVYIFLFIIIGVVTIAWAFALYLTMRATTLLEHPPDLKMLSMLGLLFPPGLSGFLIGILPISLVMLLFHLLLKGYDDKFIYKTTGGQFGLQAIYTDYTWTLIDVTKIHYMDPSYDASMLGQSRAGRLGLAFCTLGMVCLLIGVQIFIPKRESKREKDMEQKREKDASKEDIWMPNTWKRSNLLFCSFLAVLYGVLFIEFSFWSEFGDYVWFIIAATMLLDILLGNLIDGQMRETLLGNPVNTGLVVVQGLSGLASDDLVDFLVGHFVGFGMTMLVRIYVDPLFGDLDMAIETVGNSISWVKSKMPKALVGKQEVEADAGEEAKKEEPLKEGEAGEAPAESSDTVEPLLDSFGSYSCDVVTYWYTPFSTFLMILYREESGLPIIYEIKEADMAYYVYFGIIIIPFLMVADILLHSCLELYHGWKLHDYLVYTRYRFLQRECRWKGLEDSLDECIDESLRTLDQMCFSSQYYMMMTIHVNGIFMFGLGIEMMLRAQYNFLGDQAMLVIVPFVVWSSIFVRKVLLYLAIYFKLWKIKHENTAWHSAIPEEDEFDIPGWEDLNGASHDAFIMNQRITQETFRFKFLNYNRTWLINQLPSILTPRTLRRSRPYLINQFTRILNSLNQEISSDDEEEAGPEFGPVTLSAPSRQLIRWWLAQARRRMRLREVVQPLINKARGTQCEICLSRKQLNVECIVQLEVLAEKFDLEHPEDEFDQVAWKTFWIRHQRYKTICLACVSSEKEKAKKNAMKGGGGGGGGGGADDDDEEDDTGAGGGEWDAVYLSPAARAIMLNWYAQAQSRVFGKGGRKRKQVVVDVSDDEGDEMPSRWAQEAVELTEASKALAVRWLRTARNRLQKNKKEGPAGKKRPGDKAKRK